MKRKFIPYITLLPIIFWSLLGAETVEAQKKLNLIGRETVHFTLPSTEDRPISYSEEYYGKYNLIITFFPAAFTPL